MRPPRTAPEPDAGNRGWASGMAACRRVRLDLRPGTTPNSQEAYDRVKVLYRNRPELLAHVGPEAMHGSFRVTLDDPIRVDAFHQALCGGRKTGDCPFGLVLLDNRSRADQATGAGAVRVRP